MLPESFEQVQIKAVNDINANAIMNSDIECGQDVIVSGKYGIIIGGKVSATRYIHATIIGNMSEVKTTISAGVDGDLFAKLTKCEQDMSAVNGELAKITNVLGQIQILMEKSDRKDLGDKKMALMRTKIEKVQYIEEVKYQQKLVRQEDIKKVNQLSLQKEEQNERVRYYKPIVLFGGNAYKIIELTKNIPYKDAVYNLMEYFKIDEDLAERILELTVKDLRCLNKAKEML